MQLQPLRGFRDFYPGEMAARRKVFDKITATARCYGFREIDMPSLESTELIKRKSGDEIVEELFSFTDKGGREVTLIPETTPTIARMVGADKVLLKPVKWFSFGKLWRYEEPQAGRLREFYQLNIDIFGAPGVEAEAELLAFSVRMLDALRLSGKFVLRISDRNILSECFPGQDSGSIFRIIDKKQKLSEREFRAQLELLNLNMEQQELVLALTDEGNQDFGKLENIIPKTEQARVALSRLRKLFELLELYGVRERCRIDMSIVRGLAYYTGMVFECHDAVGELRALFGGGRYDKLVGLFGGEPTPAVGFALGDAVLELLMKRSGVWPAEKVETDYMVVLTEEKHIDTCIRIVESLRRKGLVAEWDIIRRKVSAQVKFADKIYAKKTIFIGEDELKDGNVLVRDMATGEQKLVPVSEIIS
jgi:histidyl-tRNA synthetase